MNVRPGSVSVPWKEHPKLLHGKDAAFSFSFLDPAHPGGGVTVDLLQVYGLPGDHRYDNESLVHCSRGVLLEQA